MFVNWLLVLLSFSFILANGISVPFEGLYKLNIVHYNDFHARFEETSVELSTCIYNNNSCIGGFPRLYYEIQQLLHEKPDAILLNAGDSFQGTYWYTMLKWNITQKFMNMLPHDAHAIGNHEFDDGPAGLAPYLSALKAPVLAANMDTSNEPSMQDLYKSSIVVERNKRKIGIIGLITPETKTLSSPGNVTFTDPRAAMVSEAKKLNEAGVDLIVVLSHCGLDVDKELARDHGNNIDIIVGGHSHSLLWNGESPSNEQVAGPYPIIVQPTADSNHNVLIVQASAFTKYLGNLSVYFDYKGEYVKWDGGPIFLNRSIPEDEDIKAKLEPYAKLVHEAEIEPIGESHVTLNFEDCVFGECALGNLLTDALNDYSRSVQTKYENVALMQRGNIKSSIVEGTITTGTLFSILPYDDRIQTFELKGSYLLEALERSVIDAWAMDPFKGPWVLQVSGLRVTYNLTNAENSRVVSVTIGDNNKDLDPEQRYQVTVSAYLGDGGDGFTMLKDGRENVKVIGRDQKVVTDYIRKHSPLQYTTEGRRINFI